MNGGYPTPAAKEKPLANSRGNERHELRVGCHGSQGPKPERVVVVCCREWVCFQRHVLQLPRDFSNLETSSHLTFMLITESHIILHWKNLLCIPYSSTHGININCSKINVHFKFLLPNAFLFAFFPWFGVISTRGWAKCVGNFATEPVYPEQPDTLQPGWREVVDEILFQDFRNPGIKGQPIQSTRLLHLLLSRLGGLAFFFSIGGLCL